MIILIMHNIIRRPRCPRGSAPKKPCFGCFGPRPCGQRRRHSIPVLYGGEFWQGLSCCGVSLFRMLAERGSSRPLRATEAAIAAPSTAPSTTWFLHGFFMLSKLPVWWCQALALAFLHLSCGRQKATLGSFSGAGFWTGWAWILLGFGLFRHRAERRPELPPKLPLQLHPLHGFCIVFFMLSKLPVWWCQALALAFFIFLVGVRRRR